MHTASTFGLRFDPRRNNFDALRLGAALVVLLSHSYSLTGAPWEPISTWFGYGYGGSLAVAVFFVMSGFLVSRSLESRDLSSFVRGRLLRIMPGLAFVTAIEAFILAPLFYEGPVASYFSNFALPHLRNILVFGEDPAIPGVFSKLPFPYVNGSLWTLPVESLFYLLLPFLALAARGRRPVVLLAWGLSLLAEPFAHWHGLDDANFGGFLVQTVRLYSVAEFSCYFLAGVAAWTYRDAIPFSGGAAVLCLVLLWAAKGGLAAPLLLKVCLPYLVLFLALQGGAGSRLKRRVGDLSYGLYLFSYPLTNVIIALNPQFSPEVVAGMAAAASLAAAWVSWRLVEAPALRLKRPDAAAQAPPRPAPPVWRPPQPGGNFAALRLFAVGLVVYGNGLLLTGGAPTAYWGAPTSRIGLDLLFAISGYLALESWGRRPRLVAFAVRRATRLLPGLAACVLFTVAVVGPLATSLPFRAYPLNRMTLGYLSNAALVPSLWLPGVFQGQQWSGAVNPMLWTLGTGAVLWAGVAAIGPWPARGRAAALAAAAALCVAAALLPPLAIRPRLAEAATEAPFFLLAALYRQAEDGRPGFWLLDLSRADVAVALFAANWISATWFGAGNYVFECLSLPHMAIAFGRLSAPGLGRLGRLGNPSYGFYLYAFPLQQLIVARWPGAPYPVLACGALALLAGFASWHLIEHPALAWAARRRPQPAWSPR